MDSGPWVIPLAAASCDDQRIGGKAAQLARLHRAGFRIAPGFSVTVDAYEQFLRDTQLQRVIQMELGRKPFEELRWEELWDAELRVRNRFSMADVPLAVAQSICPAVLCGAARIVPVCRGGSSGPRIRPSGMGVFVVGCGSAVPPRTGPRSADEGMVLAWNPSITGTKMEDMILCAFPDTVKLASQAAALGCGGVLMLPPFYYKGVSACPFTFFRA